MVCLLLGNNLIKEVMDYEIDYDECCPKCDHSPIHYRDCCEFDCEDGYIDESYDDPINFMEGESYVMCDTCYGTGVEIWCPECGYDISAHNYVMKIKETKIKK